MDQPSQDSEAIVEWVRRAQRRDADAFAALIGRYERMALAVAFGALSDSHAAADAVQDAVAKAWQKLADLKDPGRFGTWFCGIVRNGAIDMRRRARLAPKPVLDSMPETSTPAAARFAGKRWADDPADQALASEEQKLVAAALDGLDEVSRSVVVLRYYEGLSSKEIGQVLEMNPTAVDMRLSRARQQMKQTLLAGEAMSGKRAETA